MTSEEKYSIVAGAYYMAVQHIRSKQYPNRFKRQKDARKNQKYYEFIPWGEVNNLIDTLSFLFKALKNHDDDQFLDVGCGIGNIMQLAKAVGFDAHGIEYNKTLEPLSICNNIKYIDGFKYKDYANYDVIYMYHPIEDHKLELKLEASIMRQMKVGAYLMTPLSMMCKGFFETKAKITKSFKRVEIPIYTLKKIKEV